MACSKLENLEERLAEMRKLRDETRALVQNWEATLGSEETAETAAFLLENLKGAENVGSSANSKSTKDNLRRTKAKK